ncbi:hypothetical protein [Nocardioides sp.]|uniref:hypothetical protein n=1 Tax=Nocardioides sp. TaxID=35761 RepID=UPI0035B3046B
MSWRAFAGENVARTRDERALQGLVGPLWETVTRVADGFDPDDADKRVIATAQAALRGELELRRYVRDPREAAPLPRSFRGSDTFIDLIWLSAEYLAHSSASHSNSVLVSLGPASGGDWSSFGLDEGEDEEVTPEVNSLLAGSRDDGIEQLISDLARICDGNREVARAYDHLFARVALLAESSSGNTLIQ